MICTYILECADGTYYVGSTNDLERRLRDHGLKQNRHTKTRLPVKLVFKKSFDTLKEAIAYEYFVKRQRNKNFYKKLISGPIV